ncbi:MAG: hypothetical protein WCC10_11510 [Tumebacillaceae bacterium]
MEQQRRQTYEERFLRAYERLEKPLVRVVLIGFVLIVVAQFVLAMPAGRQLLSSADRLEGQRTSGGAMPTTAAENASAELTLRLVGVEGLPKAWVKVNGTPVKSFSSQEVTVPVREGDVLTVDTSATPGLYRFEVDHDAPQISYPVPGTLVESNEGKAAEVGPVRMMK